MAVMIRAVTSEDVTERAEALRMLLKMQCGNGLMHESVNVEDPEECTRPIFEWANTLLVATVESLLGVDCDAAAERQRQKDLLVSTMQLQLHGPKLPQ